MTRSQTVAGLLALACWYSAACQSASKVWSFEPRPYFDPLIAGVRDPNIAALGYARADRFDHQVEPDRTRQVWDIDLGIELPVMGWESRANTGQLQAGAFGVGFWIPIDFHMIEDFVDDSNPIINTDYRFGGMFKVQYGKSSSSQWSARIFVGHESTHLGDEFSLAGQRAHPSTFERINVSWEFVDLGLQYQREHARGGSWRARFGLTSTLPFGDGYYSVDPASATQSAIGPVIESHNSIDPYIGAEFVIDQILLKASGSAAQWGGYLSTEMRYRSVYDYHRASADVAEDRQPSVNVILGVQKVGGRFDRVSPFVRFYHGVNPNGQFRNQRSFTLYGVGLRLQR